MRKAGTFECTNLRRLFALRCIGHWPAVELFLKVAIENIISSSAFMTSPSA